MTPFLFFLHPLVITLYLVLAAALRLYCLSRYLFTDVSATVEHDPVFWLAAIARGIYSFFTLSLYEVSFVASGEISEYFLISRLENILFLAAAIEIAILVLLSQSIVHSRRRFVKDGSWLVSLQSFVLLIFAAKFLLRDNLFALVVVGSLGIPAYSLSGEL